MTTPATKPQATSTPQPSAGAAPGVRGSFVWHDYITTDIEAAKKFYTTVLGWGTEQFPGMPYTMWTASGAPRGGFGDLPEEERKAGARPYWLTSIAVEDVDRAAGEATALGATIVNPPEDIPGGVGRFAILNDPQGARFCLYKSGTAMAHDDNAPIGDASWHEIWSRDPDGSHAFYMKLFGWESAGEFEDPTIGVYRMFGRGGIGLGGFAPITADMGDVPPHVLPYFRVEDLTAAVERVKANGGHVIVGPMEVPGGDHIAQCMDPLGGVFAIHQVGQ